MIFLLVAEGILGSIAGYAYHSINQGRLKNVQTKLIKENSTFVNKLQSIFQSALKDMGLDQNCQIKLLITNCDNPAYAFGNFFSKERGVVAPAGFFEEADDALIAFIFKHEIAHIQKSHLLKIPSYSFLAGSISLLATYVCSINPIISVAICALSTLATIFLYTRSSEAEADDVAVLCSSKEEIQSFINRLKKAREQIRSLREFYKKENNLRYYQYSKEGDLLVDFLHPSLSSRELRIEEMLKKRH